MRKTARFVVTTDDENNRDRNKVFLLTEMPAMQAEKWAARALLALARSGKPVDHAAGNGMAALAVATFESLSGLEWNEIEPLMDEMMGCVQIRLGSTEEMWRHVTGQDDIEEVGTLFAIRSKIFELHTGFSIADIKSRSMSARKSED